LARQPTGLQVCRQTLSDFRQIWPRPYIKHVLLCQQHNFDGMRVDRSRWSAGLDTGSGVRPCVSDGSATRKRAPPQKGVIIAHLAVARPMWRLSDGRQSDLACLPPAPCRACVADDKSCRSLRIDPRRIFAASSEASVSRCIYFRI